MSIQRTFLLVAIIMSGSATTRETNAQQAGEKGLQQYTLFINERASELARRTSTTTGVEYWRAYADFGDTLKAAGILRGGTALETGGVPRIVTVRRGVRQVRGTSSDVTAEQLGGYFVIAVPSMEDAIGWAARVPSALTGSITVAPSYPAPTMMSSPDEWLLE